MKESKPRASKKAPFTLEAARAKVLAKVAKGGAKGAGSPVTAKTKEPELSLYGKALEELEAERAIYVDRNKEKPKYFAREFAPSIEGVAVKLEQYAARNHPKLLTFAELKKVLSKTEEAFAQRTLELLEADRRLVKLIRKTSALYACGDSLRALLRVESAQVEDSGEAIRRSYVELVRSTGFPDVEISTLQSHAGVPMSSLKDWLRVEHQNGRANFGVGDWSLASEAVRAGVIDLPGRTERYLWVRLED